MARCHQLGGSLWFDRSGASKALDYFGASLRCGCGPFGQLEPPHRHVWAELGGLDADIALLQEVALPTPGCALATVALDAAATAAEWTVSRPGSIAAADVAVEDRTVFTAVSVYAAWEMAGRLGYADASAHRILSDVSALMGARRHRLVIAGDWNILRGYGEMGSAYWKARYDTVFDGPRHAVCGFAGPVFPNGQQAEPWPDELPVDSCCVPTFHHNRATPEAGPSPTGQVMPASFGAASGVREAAIRCCR